MRAVDIFCGAGGASRGLMQAGFVVTGVDIKPQKNYCGDAFIQADALEYLATADLSQFEIIWCSPPCQFHSAMKTLHNARPHLNLIPDTRDLLRASGKPYVIENVEGAREWLINPFMLCGTSFNLEAAGRELQRHRLFETSFPVTAPPCQHSGRPVIGVYGGHVRDRRRPPGKNHVSGSNLPITVGREAMGMPWATGAELSEAIPPAYSRFIAETFLAEHAQAPGAASSGVSGQGLPECLLKWKSPPPRLLRDPGARFGRAFVIAPIIGSYSYHSSRRRTRSLHAITY